MQRLSLGIILSLLTTSCVTTSRSHDCFDISIENCVTYYDALLSDNDRATPKSQKLYKQICDDDQIACVFERGTEIFPLQLSMAKKGYVSLRIRMMNGEINGFFIRADSSKSRSEYRQKFIELGNLIDQCDSENLVACELIVQRTSFGPDVAENSKIAAKQRICTNKDYKCLIDESSEPYIDPPGWKSVVKSQSSTIKDGKMGFSQEIILKRVKK
jgi:hypothetical protein